MRQKTQIPALVILALGLAALAGACKKETAVTQKGGEDMAHLKSVVQEPFGRLSDGTAVEL